MSNRVSGELVGMPLGKRSVPNITHSGYQRAGSHDRPDMKLSDGLWSFVLRHIAHHYVPSLSARRPARYGVIQSPPGEGKTEGVRVTCSRGRVDLIVVSAAELAGETENAGPAALARLGEAVAATTAREGRPLAVLLDDFDLSIVARLGSTEYTVDSQLLTGALQHLADAGAMRDADGVPVPILVTGNDFTACRGSLFRPGRAVFFEHVVSLEDKCAIVGRLLGGSDEKSVRGLVAAYRKQPVAFFAELRARAMDEDLDAVIKHHGLDVEAIESELKDGGCNKVAFDRLHQLAAAAAGSSAVNFLGRR